MEEGAIAVARVDFSTRNWILKVDHIGLFRWYLDGAVETNLRGCTVVQAESALRRFVDDSLRVELKITYLVERIGSGSESGRVAFQSPGMG
jgi:hypothetical protein